MREQSGWTRVLALLAAAAASLAIMLAACARPAGAVVVRVQGHPFSYQPAPPPAASARSLAQVRSAHPKSGGGKSNGKAPLILHKGGVVMPANTNYLLYWDPAGAPEYPVGYVAGVNRFFEDLAHDSGGLLNSDSILTQYDGAKGESANYNSHFGGALFDTNPYPANGCAAAPKCLTDAQIRTEIRSYVEAHKLPIDIEHEYFLLTPEGVESCEEAAGEICSAGTTSRVYCAYHSFIEVGGAPLIYADAPYLEGRECDPGREHPNGNPSDAEIAGGLAHEHSESVTDPKLDAWYDGKGLEVADKCRSANAKVEYGEPLGQAPNKENYNQIINGDLYLYQQMWSNAFGECQQRVEQYPAVTKVKPKSGSPAGGTAVTITGKGFVAPATVRFEGVPASEVVVHSETTITAVTPSGTPSTTVDVTITTPAGTSPITKKDHFKYKSH